ncbi:MAG: hypothetical protein ACI9FN_003054, partial [Saprospiraceae bacterium]
MDIPNAKRILGKTSRKYCYFRSLQMPMPDSLTAFGITSEL